MSLDDYLLAHIDPEPEYLHRLWRAKHLHLNYPRMASGHLQGRVLKMLTHMIRPRTILEIGTFTGYSTLCMASALESGATIHTIEINDEQEDFTRPWLENSPWADKIRFYIGDALQMLNGEMSNDETASNQMVNVLTLSSSMPTSATMWITTAPYCPGSARVASSWQTIPCGTDMWSSRCPLMLTGNRATEKRPRRKASWPSMTSWPQTLRLSASSCLCATASR